MPTALFVSLAKTVSIAFDSKTTGMATAQEYAYDTATGNLTTATDLGDVTLTQSGLDGSGKYAGNGSYTDTGSDKLTTVTEYALNTGAHLLALPKRTETKNQSAAVNTVQRHLACQDLTDEIVGTVKMRLTGNAKA